MRTKNKSLFTLISVCSILVASPPVLNVYVIPFDNIKDDVAISWLSDAFAEMVNKELSQHDRIYLKDKAGFTAYPDSVMDVAEGGFKTDKGTLIKMSRRGDQFLKIFVEKILSAGLKLSSTPIKLIKINIL